MTYLCEQQMIFSYFSDRLELIENCETCTLQALNRGKLIFHFEKINRIHPNNLNYTCKGYSHSKYIETFVDLVFLIIN